MGSKPSWYSEVTVHHGEHRDRGDKSGFEWDQNKIDFLCVLRILGGERLHFEKNHLASPLQDGREFLAFLNMTSW